MNLTANQILLLAGIASASGWTMQRVPLIEASEAFRASSIAGVVRSLVLDGIVEATHPWESARTIGLTPRGLDVLYAG